MNAKHLVYVAIFIAALATISIVSDDSAGAEYEEYKVYCPDNGFSDDYTRFDLKAGTLDVEIDYGYSSVYNVYLVIGTEEYYFNGGTMYVPYDVEDAYFYSRYDDSTMVLKAKLTNVAEDYDVKGKLYSGTYYSEYNSDNPSLIELDAGTYTFKFSRSGYLENIDDYNDRLEFQAGVTKTVVIDRDKTFYYHHNSNFSSYHNSSLPIYYSATPDTLFPPTPSGLEMTSVSSNTTVKWYKQTVALDEGSHHIDGSLQIYAFDDPSKAAWFEENIVRKGVILQFSKSDIGALDWSFTLGSPTTIHIYALKISDDGRSDYVYVDSERYGPGELIIGGDVESIYLLANTVSKIMVEYDHSKYRLYISDSMDKILLPSGVMLELNNSISKEYSIIAEPVASNSPDCLTAEYLLYTEGIPESDDNAVLFAVVSIVICAVFFGLLLMSGRKPKWKD